MLSHVLSPVSDESQMAATWTCMDFLYNKEVCTEMLFSMFY